MSDDDILAYYRRRHPHIALASAKGAYRTWLKFRHLGAAVEEKQREAADTERHRLRQQLFGPQS